MPRAPSWDSAPLSEELAATGAEGDDSEMRDDAPSINPTTHYPVARPQKSDPPTGGAPDDAYLEPGTVLGEYRIEAQIGEGGMGVVYSAVHPLIGKRAAVKVLKAELCRSAFNVERFIDEARIVNQIGHPNIVDVFAFGRTSDGRSYFIMEWLKGESLRDRVARDRLDLDEICAVVKPLARALEAAHEQGVIHRDLKPDNIYLIDVRGDAPTVKLLDFGIAKLSREEHRMERTATGAMVGTPQYIAPEQAKGYTIDHRVDIYALGGIVFELLTGRPPFVADNAMEMVAKHLMEAVPRPSTYAAVPPELDDLVVRMLSKSPDGRPSLAEVQTVIERTSALDRTNVKQLPSVPPSRVQSELIDVPIPTGVSNPSLKALKASPAVDMNPQLSSALAKAMAPNTLSERHSISDMTETIRARKPFPTTKAALFFAVFAAAVAAAYLVVRTVSGDKPESTKQQQPVVEPQQPNEQPKEPPKATIVPIEEGSQKPGVATPKEPAPPIEPPPKETAVLPPPPVEPPPKETPKEPGKKTTPKPSTPPKKPKLGRLELSIVGGNGTPKVTVDGVASGPSKELTVGEHKVVVTSKGHKPQSFTVVIK